MIWTSTIIISKAGLAIKSVSCDLKKDLNPSGSTGLVISVLFFGFFLEGGGHNWEQIFIHFLHVLEHIDHS